MVGLITVINPFKSDHAETSLVSVLQDLFISLGLQVRELDLDPLRLHKFYIEAKARWILRSVRQATYRGTLQFNGVMGGTHSH